MDSVYEKAHQDCLRVNANLKQLQLSNGDRALLIGSGGSTLVADKIRSLEEEILTKIEKGSRAKRVTDLANVFCEFGARVTPVLQVMVPQSPEYNVPFGCVALIFKVHKPLPREYQCIILTISNAVAMRNERETNLSDFLINLSHSLPLASFYRDVFPTTEMKTVVASMYIEIVDLLERATKYYCLGRLGIISGWFYLLPDVLTIC